ncbi:hypothetical protein ACQ4PT_030640 [Festuca glaucescens]
MSISVNGQSVVPPGFRFHPTEEELLTYYLAKKVASLPIDMDVIPDIDLNKLEPWDIQERCRIGTGPQNDWYLFSHKDKKYPTGTRTNRATAAGFWKATGRDKAIYSAAGSGRIGMRKTLVFYKGRAPHGHKSDWIMHEYRLDDVAAAHPGSGDVPYYSGASSPTTMASEDCAGVVVGNGDTYDMICEWELGFPIEGSASGKGGREGSGPVVGSVLVKEQRLTKQLARLSVDGWYVEVVVRCTRAGVDRSWGQASPIGSMQENLVLHQQDRPNTCSIS